MRGYLGLDNFVFGCILFLLFGGFVLCGVRMKVKVK